MKQLKKVIIVSICIFSAAATFAQKVYTKSDIFTIDKIVWFGIDYTQMKMKGEYSHPGDPMYKTPAQIAEDFFESWNTVIVSEPLKYNVKKTFGKIVVENDVMVVEKRNKTIDPMELITHKEYVLNKDVIKDIVKGYKSFTNKEGIGVVFFAECLSNDDKTGTYYVTFFDIASGTVLICEKVNGKPGGVGLKNYWAGSMVDALSDAKKQYKTWK